VKAARRVSSKSVRRSEARSSLNLRSKTERIIVTSESILRDLKALPLGEDHFTIRHASSIIRAGSKINSSGCVVMAEATGKFVKELVIGMRKHGQYRGEGCIQVSPSGVAITGKHVYSLGQRWLFGILVGVVVAVGTLGTVAPGVLLLYPVVEYLWLKKGDQLVTFDRIEAYNAVPQSNLIAIQFTGTRWESPAVLRTPEWRAIYDALWAFVPHARVS
jgi:hypothetical protein